MSRPAGRWAGDAPPVHAGLEAKYSHSRLMVPGSLRLRGRLLLSHLAVIAVGTVVLLAGVGLIAPDVFNGAMDRAMGGGVAGMGDMMSGLVRSTFQDAVRTALAVATVVAGGAAVVMSFALSARLSGPIAQLAGAARRVAAGHYGERVPVAGHDEIAELATSFNLMAASLEATERRRVELVGDVAHELRTPLATLDGYLEGLEDGVVEPGAATWTLLRAETSRLTRLVGDLQQLWRAEARQLSLVPRTIDVGAFLRAALDRFAARAQARSIHLRLDVAPDVGQLRADPDRLAQVLDNYLANAIRYGPAAGAVLLSARPAHEGVVLAVTDQGPGLTAEQRDRVFERFYRIDPSRSRALGGSGIGLAVARALAEAMGGRAWAESAGPGRGATFLVWVPATG